MKSFNSTELKVGDRVQDKIGDVKKVVEVFENTFVLGGDKFGEYIFSYKIAIEQGWTILDSKPENETVEITFSNKNIGTITYEQMQKNINTNIIANNNELIEEIVNVRKNYMFGDDSGMYKAIQIIQSKNDLLNKE